MHLAYSGLLGAAPEALAYLVKHQKLSLGYLVKHQRLSLSAMHENLVRDASNALMRRNTKRMLADVLTKPLDHDRHWTLLAMMGMSTPSGSMPAF